MYMVLPRILCVDDEPNVLDGIARNLRRNFDVTIAVGGEAGLAKVIEEGPFTVVMSDQRMPGMDGVTLLSRVREISPDTVRILLTGYADTDAAIAAVNRGAVFRFLTKPIEAADLQRTLTLAAEHHRTTTTDRVLLERTFHGSIKALTDMLALVNPAGYGRASRARAIVAEIGRDMDEAERWRFEIAAMLSQVGSVALDAGAGDARLSRIAADVVGNIPRLEEIREMVAMQDLRYDGTNGQPGGPRQGSIPQGARMLKIALDLEALEAQGVPRPTALETLTSRPGWYDMDLLRKLGAPAQAGLAPLAGAFPGATGFVRTPSLASAGAMPTGAPFAAAAMAPAAPVAAPPAAAPAVETREVEMRKIEPGMVLAEDVCTAAGRVLIGRGDTVTWQSVDLVRRSLDFNTLRTMVRVVVPQREVIARPPRPISW